MKILLVAPQPYYAERGTPIAVRLLARTLASLGHDVDLLAYPFGDDPNDKNVRVHRCARLPGFRSMPIGFSFAKLCYDVPLSLSVIGRQLRHRYDVIHAVEESVYPALLASIVGRTRVVYDMDSSLVEQLAASGGVAKTVRPILNWFERFAIQRSNKVVAVCDELVDLARAHKSASDVAALYDVPNFESNPSTDQGQVEDLRAGITETGTLALYVGNLERYQGIDLLLESLVPFSKRDDLSVVVVGGIDSHIEYYRDIAQSHGIDSIVRFVGPRPLEQLRELLQQADILLSPRITGGNTPMKLYSYMAAEKAILATRLSTHTQVLTDGSAVLTEPTAAAYGDGLAALLNDRAYRENLGAAAKQLVDERYSLKTYTETLASVYAGLE
ncbi:MAG: glycosyltransferase [Pseudomonadota bacterium]